MTQLNIKSKENHDENSINNSKFSRREWLFVITVLMMIEYWLISISYEFVGWQEVVNFISFAAAIASILLAVIAIIYGFIQSDSNSKTTGVLREQAESLRSHTQSLSESSNSITKQLDIITSITDKLDSLDENIHASAQRLAGVEKTVEGMNASNKEFMDAIQAKRAGTEPVIKSSGDSISHEDLLVTIFKNTSHDLDILAYSLYKYYLSKKAITLMEFGNTFDEILEEGNGGGRDVFYSVEAILRTIGFFSSTNVDDILIINEKFENILQDCAESAEKSRIKALRVLIKRADEIINKIKDS